ncbi:MAG: outer membrane beta-barrel protein [Betaproteobacteria bacterium]|nr:outer membrane beta-barrel protein [Betaproteobacteria bacterium]
MNQKSTTCVYWAAAAAVAVSALAAPAWADDSLSPWLVRVRLLDVATDRSNSAGGGVASDTLKVSDKVQPEVDVSYFFTKNIAAELVATYPVSHNINLSGTDIGGLKELPPTLNLQYHFDGMGTFMPYLGAGVTYMRTWDSSAAGGTLTTSQNNWGADLQAGMDYALTKHWLFNVDVKKIWIDAKVQTTSGTDVLTAHINPWLLGVGFGYRF